MQKVRKRLPRKMRVKNINGKRVKIVGVWHVPTTHDKGLGSIIQESEIVAIEGYADTTSIDYEILLEFIGKRGVEILRKNETNLTTIDPIYKRPMVDMTIHWLVNSLPYYSLLIGSGFINPLLPIVFLLFYLPVSSRKIVDREYGWKYLEALKSLEEYFQIPLASKRDIGMAYGIKKLAERYEDILCVVGRNHLSNILRLLDNPDKVGRLFKKYEKDFKREMLEIYEPRNLKIIEYIPFKTS